MYELKQKGLGLSVTPVTLGITNYIISLGTTYKEGFLPITESIDNPFAFLFGDGSMMLYGSLEEIEYGR